MPGQLWLSGGSQIECQAGKLANLRSTGPRPESSLRNGPIEDQIAQKQGPPELFAVEKIEHLVVLLLPLGFDSKLCQADNDVADDINPVSAALSYRDARPIACPSVAVPTIEA